MAQLFSRSSNVIARTSVALALCVPVAAIGLAMVYDRSDYTTDVAVAPEQPVMFSHAHHVAGLGIHCGYCHTSVEVSAYAGIPPTHTCMSCHSQIWTESAMLEPVRASYRSGESLAWVRVHDLPQFVFFNHSAHLSKGIGCSSCHGDVSRMNLIFKVNTLKMEWCLDCHRAPEKHVRPKVSIYDPSYRVPVNQKELGAKLVAEYGIQKLLDCYTCHR